MLATLVFAGVLAAQDFEYVCRPAARAVRELGQRFNENWEVAADMGRNVVVVRPGDDDAGEVRAGLAEVLNAEWVEFDDRWVLRRSDEQRAALLEAERATNRAGIAQARDQWVKESQKQVDLTSWFRQTESLAIRGSQGDQEASLKLATESIEGGCLQAHFFNALLAIPVETLEEVDLDHPQTFSTRPKPGQLPLPERLVREIVDYQREYATQVTGSLERVPEAVSDPRTRLSTKFGEVDRIIVYVERGFSGMTVMRGFYVNRDGWVICYAYRTFNIENEATEFKGLEGLQIDIPEKTTRFKTTYLNRLKGTTQHPRRNEFLDVDRTDPADWSQGSFLGAVSQKLDRPLYAVLSDAHLFTSGFLFGEQSQDAGIIFRNIFNVRSISVDETHGDIRIEPRLPLLNEKAYLDRVAFSEYAYEFQADGYLRPHPLGRYVCGQDSAVTLDSWDQWLVMPSLPDNTIGFTKYFRLAYFALGTGVPQSGEHPSGRFLVSGSKMTESVWIRVKRELQSPFRLSDAYPESKSESGDVNIRGLIATESYPNGLPRSFNLWASVLNEEVLVNQYGDDHYTSRLAWPKRDWAVSDFLSDGMKYALNQAEVMTYGVGNSNGERSEIVFENPNVELNFVAAKDMPPVWRDWLGKQDGLYRESFPERKPIQVPPE